MDDNVTWRNDEETKHKTELLEQHGDGTYNNAIYDRLMEKSRDPENLLPEEALFQLTDLQNIQRLDVLGYRIILPEFNTTLNIWNILFATC